MKKEQIKKVARKLKDKKDLLDLLNRMKKDEANENGYAEKFRPFSLRQLSYYSNPNKTKYRFKQFKIRKKTPGKYRTITAPKNITFRLILHYINEIYKAVYTPSKYAMGFTEGRSIVDNAKAHKGMNYVLNIDLEDFFPSIEQRRVRGRLMVKPCGFTLNVANVVAGLCAMKEERTLEDGNTAVFYVLPQGAPTSPILTNMICDRLDHFLAGLAKRFGLNYTRYADDITFSSMHYVYKKTGEFWKELERIINQEGFHMNPNKTRLQVRGHRQEVTGIIVSNKLNVTQKYVRDIRNLLYIWERHGLGVAECVFQPKYKNEKGHVKKGTPDLINVLEGKLLYLKMVKGEDDSVYLRLHTKFDTLKDGVLSSMNTSQHGIVYLETTNLVEFEKNNKVTVEIVLREKNQYASFMLKDKKVLATINKSLKPEDVQKKEMLAISRCKNQEGKYFWLIHKASKPTTMSPESVNIDELITCLDSFLINKDG